MLQLTLSNIPVFMLIIIGIIVISAIGFAVYYFNPKQVIIRKLSKIPNKPIGGLKSNQLSKITGKALHVTELLIAPLSKRKCIFYSITIQQRKSTGKSSHWRTILKEEKIQTFFIDNNGDFTIIKPTENPKNYSSYLVQDHKTKSSTFNDPTPEFEAVLKHYNINSKGFFGSNKSLRYTEGVIEIGEKITVAGIAKWKTLSEPIPEYSYSKIAVLESTEKQKLIITDLPEVIERNRF